MEGQIDEVDRLVLMNASDVQIVAVVRVFNVISDSECESHRGRH
jgi:hypothetical protein